jgi:serine/threonine-protein kinase
VITDKLSAALADRYRIERHLGAGGMATVYLAEDLKHDRRVALKVLKPELAAVLGAERFVVEIKTTAGLQHPHILPLFDSGTADGFLYYVMPFIEGETLRDKLNREAQLGVDEAVRIARDVADALDYAHRHGVIHRDIKPENILLHDGRPVVADFGIALAVSAAAGGRMTETGLSLGTPHYMSPEQATADKEITGRSDVYSLASVLYEMLAGQPPHLGGSAQQIIMKIIAEPVDAVTRYRKAVPPNVAAALAKALEKLPADRFATAREFADALQDARFTTARTSGVAMAGSESGRASRRIAMASMAVAGIATVLAAWGWLRPHPAPPQPVIRYVDALLKDSLLRTQGRDLAVSPDGKRIVIVAGANLNTARLLIRERSQLMAAPIPGSDGGFVPMFSPDGRRVAFLNSARVGFTLKTVSLDGGAPRTITDSITGTPGAWEQDGFIYVQKTGTSVLARVHEGGGELTPFTKLDTSHKERTHRTARSMFDGRRMLFIAVTADSGPQVAIADLSTGSHRHVGIRATAAWFAPPRHLVYVTEAGALMVVAFDNERGVPAGNSEILAEGITRPGVAADLDISATGTLVYAPVTDARAVDEVRWLNRDGSLMPTPLWNADFGDLALSPDGNQLVVGIRERGNVELWVRQVESGSLSRLTFAADGSSEEPAWTLDGTAVTFIVIKDSTRAVYQRRADGSTAATPVGPTGEELRDISWAPGGQLLVETSVRSNRDVFTMRPGRDSVMRPLLSSRSSEIAAAVSPDGRWVAYVSNESGRNEVYVRPFADPSAHRAQVSTSGGNAPRWSRTGHDLYFVRRSEPNASASDSLSQSAMMVAAVRPGPTFVSGPPREVFRYSGPISYWDVTPDGKRFVIVTQAQQSDARLDVIVADNWLAELKRPD